MPDAHTTDVTNIYALGATLNGMYTLSLQSKSRKFFVEKFFKFDLTFIAGHIPTLTTSLSGKTATAIIVEGNITKMGVQT